ncbi:hypothetical protein NHX12_001435 [Muraenolepis orangiensis]|uniref:Uncharacterized protein n=1 Tax=Muraenolepis orangiensis TaxID=630683 RepID=A0A9Q0DYF7_9TELE|nr:hypothetical protein NHX12_001435 [Muraenolepis orangiensis]
MRMHSPSSDDSGRESEPGEKKDLGTQRLSPYVTAPHRFSHAPHESTNTGSGRLFGPPSADLWPFLPS